MACLITSQIDTAPKRNFILQSEHGGLITSQIDTAPKQPGKNGRDIHSLITSQIDTAPKRHGGNESGHSQFDYQSDRHRSKTGSIASS